MKTKVKTAEDRIAEALSVALEFGSIDGAHHKMWVIDQMCRALLGEHYDKFVEDAESDPDACEWDEGIAP